MSTPDEQRSGRRAGRNAVVLLAASLSAWLPSCPVPPPNPDAGFVEPVLAPPPPGRGIQLRVAFDVPPGTEQQQCWYFPLPSDLDLEVVRYEVRYNVGSHHMNLFRMLPSVAATTTVPATTPIDGPGVSCFDAVDFEHYDLVVGSQTEAMDWQLPNGTAYRLHAHSPMLLQSHFVNATTQSTPGNRAVVLVNLWTAADSGTITQHMGTMFANNRSISLPPQMDSEFTTRCTLPAGGTFVAMTGHFHSRGRQFIVDESTDGITPGTECYRSVSWSEPQFSILATPATVPPGGGLFYTCMFHNDTDMTITFGPHVETQEHCNLFAYYYPVDPDARARYCF